VQTSNTFSPLLLKDADEFRRNGNAEGTTTGFSIIKHQINMDFKGLAGAFELV
jgi:hypothetical protein